MMRACSASFSGGTVCAIIKNPTVSSPISRASPKCWIGDVGLGAVRGDADDRDADVDAWP